MIAKLRAILLAIMQRNFILMGIPLAPDMTLFDKLADHIKSETGDIEEGDATFLVLSVLTNVYDGAVSNGLLTHIAAEIVAELKDLFTDLQVSSLALVCYANWQRPEFKASVEDLVVRYGKSAVTMLLYHKAMDENQVDDITSRIRQAPDEVVRPAQDKPVLVMMIGAPGTGKTHYAKSMLKFSGTVLTRLSFDDYIVSHSGKTYNEAWKEGPGIIKKAQKEFAKSLVEAGKSKIPYILDMTNLTAKSRRSKLAKFPGHVPVYHVAISPVHEIHERLNSRVDQKVSWGIAMDMINKLEIPDKVETKGHKVLISVNSSKGVSNGTNKATV